MQYVSIIRPAENFIDGREVKRVDRTRAVRPVGGGEMVLAATGRPPQHEPQPQGQRRENMEERRLACRRVNHLPVLIDLRSGLDRRRHNLREGDIVEHIDEKV